MPAAESELDEIVKLRILLAYHFGVHAIVSRCRRTLRGEGHCAAASGTAGSV